MVLARSLTVAATLATVATMAIAGGHQGNPAVKARQSLMDLYGHNLYFLLGMTRDRTPYDAEQAQAAADSLVALTQVNQMRMWAPGTDSESEEGSRALAAIWENFPDVFAKVGATNAALAELQKVAGDGLEAMGPAAVAANQACNACHKDYRVQN